MLRESTTSLPKLLTDGHVFRRVKHRRSLGHRIRLRQEIQSGCRTWPLTAWLEPGPWQLGWNRDLDSLAGTRTLTAWLEPGPWQLGWNRDLDSLAGTRTSTAWLEPGLRLLGWNRDLDCLAGTGTFSAWLEPGPWLLGWNRDLDCLAGTGTSTAWLEPGPWQLGWNRNSKGRMRKFVETSGKWFPSLVRPANGPGYSSGTDHQFTQASYGWARFPGVSSTAVSLGPRIGPVGHQLPKKSE